MKQAIVLALCAMMVGTTAVAADARPQRAPRPVVAVPKLPVLRKGGLPTRQVDRGVARTAAPARGPRSTPVSRGQARIWPLVLSPAWQRRLAPARTQVLQLRKQVKSRYKSRGLGARLAKEIP